MFEELDYTDGKIKALNSIGVDYNILGKNDKALEYFLKGLKIAKQTDNYDMIIILLNNIGELYKGCMNMYEEALKYYFEAYDYCKKVDYSSYGFLLNSIGDTFLYLKNTERALEF
jgi:tetratricopeptide (TPR) repeat protein